MATSTATASRARSAAKATKTAKKAPAKAAEAVATAAEVIDTRPDDEATMFKRAQLNHAFEIANLKRRVEALEAAAGATPKGRK